MDTIEGIGELVALGGPVFVVLFVVSVAATALVLQKFLQIARLKVGRHAAAEAAVAHWVRGDAEAALAAVASDGAPSSLVVAAALNGLSREGAGEALVKEDVGRVSAEVLTRLQRYLRPLDAIAQIAPLLGLLGTVIGMIETFSSMEEAGGAVVPADLAGGIWVALLTTGFGLAIAIPVTALLAWFDGIVERERARMESLLTSIFTRRVSDAAPGVPEAAEVTQPDPAGVATVLAPE